MISCSNLTRTFGSKTVVDSISFDLPGGSICACLGPNGAGKTTTMKMLTGVLHPTSGTVTVAGLEVYGGADFLVLKRQIGVVPEGLGLFDHLSIEEHLHMSGPIYGLSREETRLRTDQLLRVLGLEDGKHTYASQCSNGMRKKTALALALLHNPQVLFLDEPFEGIDPGTAETIRELLIALAGSGATIFFTSHMLTMVERSASHLLLICNGAITWHSRMEALPSTLHELYFDRIDTPTFEMLPWLGSPRS
jgi:ABC-2 type transport system ATP-binding protein